LGGQGLLDLKPDDIMVGVISETQTYKERLYYKCGVYVVNLGSKDIKNLQVSYPNLNSTFFAFPSRIL
jgi:hypothetical protein